MTQSMKAVIEAACEEWDNTWNKLFDTPNGLATQSIAMKAALVAGMRKLADHAGKTANEHADYSDDQMVSLAFRRAYIAAANELERTEL